MFDREKWTAYMDELQQQAHSDFQASRESCYQEEKQGLIEGWIESQCPEEKKVFFDQCLTGQMIDAKRKAEFYYRQGMWDGLCILRELEVLV